MKAGDLPPLFERYYDMSGVLDFFVFKDVEAVDGDVALQAICTAIPHINAEKLRAISYREIDVPTFLGDWCDPASGALIKRGSMRADDGRSFNDPLLVDLQGVNIVSSGNGMPAAGSGGQFAYAFFQTPYGLRARPKEIQAVFNDVREWLLPSGKAHTIMDWSSPELPGASPHFAAGMEWWGVFLFTIHVPDFRRLVVISGSATD